MAKQQDVRPIIKLRSTAGTGYTYVTRKNRRNNPDRIELNKLKDNFVGSFAKPVTVIGELPPETVCTGAPVQDES